MAFEVIFDVETQKLFGELDKNDPADLGISIVSVYIRELDSSFKEIKGEMKSFWEKDLPNLWPIFQKADRIIGFNSIKFDVPVLQPYTQIPLHKLNHFDILEQVKKSFGKRLSLNSLVKETLGVGKTDVGTNAVIYWKKGDRESLEKIKKYCESDVLITKDLYDFGLKNKFLKFTDKWNTPRTIKIDFSYPPPEEKRQIGLF